MLLVAFILGYIMRMIVENKNNINEVENESIIEDVKNKNNGEKTIQKLVLLTQIFQILMILK